MNEIVLECFALKELRKKEVMSYNVDSKAKRGYCEREESRFSETILKISKIFLHFQNIGYEDDFVKEANKFVLKKLREINLPSTIEAYIYLLMFLEKNYKEDLKKYVVIQNLNKKNKQWLKVFSNKI